MVQNFRGASLQQDGRFMDMDVKLMEATKYPASFNIKINMKNINLDAIRSWISQTTTSMLGGIEDDVLTCLIMNLLQQPNINPKMIQIQITPFLESKASSFMTVLWQLLIQAQESIDGIPPTLRELFKTSMSKERLNQRGTFRSNYKSSINSIANIRSSSPENFRNFSKRPHQYQGKFHHDSSIPTVNDSRRQTDHEVKHRSRSPRSHHYNHRHFRSCSRSPDTRYVRKYKNNTTPSPRRRHARCPTRSRSPAYRRR